MLLCDKAPPLQIVKSLGDHSIVFTIGKELKKTHPEFPIQLQMITLYLTDLQQPASIFFLIS